MKKVIFNYENRIYNITQLDFTRFSIYCIQSNGVIMSQHFVYEL